MFLKYVIKKFQRPEGLVSLSGKLTPNEQT